MGKQNKPEKLQISWKKVEEKTETLFVLSEPKITVILNYYCDLDGDLILTDGPNGKERETRTAQEVKIVKHTTVNKFSENDNDPFTLVWTSAYIDGEEIEAMNIASLDVVEETNEDTGKINKKVLIKVIVEEG